MKKILLSILGTAVFAVSATATVRTVSNDIHSPGQYTTLQAAHDASAANDTIYIHPSGTSYGTLSLTKPLVLIGGGALPDKQVKLNSHVQSISIEYNTSISSGSGSKIYGLDIADVSLWYLTTFSNAVGSITFSRNKIETIDLKGSHHNLLFYQNIIGTIDFMYGATMYNSVFSNNICNTFNVNSAAGYNNLITNNQFGERLFIGGAIISNNIFYSSTPLYFDIKTSTFTNNILVASTPVNESDIIKGTTTGTGNLFNIDPVFVTPATSSQIRYYTFTSPAAGPFANLHLQATSPGKDYGTDGTDVGIYGGTYSWIDGADTDSRYRYYPMPNQVPHMIEMNILNPTLPVDGTLNVEFNAKTKN